MSKLTTLLAIALLPFTAWAQSSWQLKSCIEYGLKNNRSSTIYENEKRMADARAKEALAEYVPKVSITGTFDNNLTVQQSIIPAGIFGPDEVRVAFTQKYNANGLVQLDQTLYDQSLLIGLKANKFNKRLAELNAEKTQETIIYNVSTAFYQLLVYREQLSLLNENLNTYKVQMDLFELQVGKGIALQKDLDKVTVDYNNALAQIRVANANLVLSENQLKYEMGFPINEQLIVDSASEKGWMNAETLINEKFQVSTITDYQLSQVNARLMEVDQQRIKAGALPRLTGYARYGAVGFGNTVSPVFDNLLPYSAIGLRLSIPLFDFFKRNAQYNQARYRTLNAQENLKINENRYQMDYENARSTLLKAQINVESTRRNIELARSVFATTDLQYTKGVSDLIEWLAAQNSIKEAQTNYLNAIASYYQARMDLEKAAGTLTNFYSAQ